MTYVATISSGQTITHRDNRHISPGPNQLTPAKTIRGVLRAQERTRTRFTNTKEQKHTAMPAHPTLSGAKPAIRRSRIHPMKRSKRWALPKPGKGQSSLSSL